MALERVLVANRGEIAARVFRTLKETGRTSIAVYATADRGAAWTKLADQAHHLPGENAAQTYLNGEAILQLAKETKSQAIHPGYGFLSEDPAFAQAVQAAGIVWLGPSPAAIRALGDKAKARQLAQSLSVGTIPGTNQPVQTWQEIFDFGDEAGYPILLKDPAGGGGRGIRELANADQVRQLAQDFGVDLTANPQAIIAPTSPLATSFLEKRLVGARHIETQCLRDQSGNFWLASTRDCSVQRRNQKLIEEAPAKLLNRTYSQLAQWSAALFAAVDYVGAGTCEFLVDENQNAYFLEVNPRLQVEHTVTEAITGQDLVQLQLAIAEGGSLTDYVDLKAPTCGHAIQLRITSEDPAKGLLPTGGTITSLAWPAGPGIRVDAALAGGETIPTAFDSLIAKLIISAPTRKGAISRCQRALAELQIGGVANSASLYQELLADPDFQNETTQKLPGQEAAGAQAESLPAHCFLLHTRWLENTHLLASWRTERGLSVTIGASNQVNTTSGATTATNASALAAASDTIPTASQASPANEKTWVNLDLEIDGRAHRLTLCAEQIAKILPGTLAPSLSAIGVNSPAPVAQPMRRSRKSTALAKASDNPNEICAPMQATLMRLPVREGQQVKAGDLVAVIEAMKMEQPLTAPRDGQIAKLPVAVGQSVATGQVIVTLAPEENRAK
ncbi:hypothetical protein BK816_05910 [Boudabousia tangfeifanii]|uniref:Uncharacterized protein n=1 Tax=Boudabousia tangfeifanii TaxID=1912795 RepID=A0A1D9MKQ0_9ACTO|nr:biotin carboxylase N-terminal domain-containing protein [Boudabousia tangfeifanii]AOZ72884.1 hypothetical protein BK816_05910 [Boudabousia tangfeifanii]